MAKVMSSFLKQLLAYYEGKIVLIEDVAPYHGSHVVKEFKLANAARLTIEEGYPLFLPTITLLRNCGKILKRIRLT